MSKPLSPTIMFKPFTMSFRRFINFRIGRYEFRFLSDEFLFFFYCRTILVTSPVEYGTPND